MALSAKFPNPNQTGTPQVNTPSGTHPQHPTTPGSSLAIWQSFTQHRRNLQVQKTTVYEDKPAKSEAQHRRHELTFVRSNEENSAAFDLAGITDVSPEDFFGALVIQHPSALGWVPSKHSASCVIVSFEDSCSRDAAVHAGVTVKNLMVPGVPTVGLANSVYQVSLDGLPLMNREVLATALRATMGRYGHILDIKLCTDKFHLLTGRGSVLLDISAASGEDAYLALEHERNGHTLQLLQERRA
ncbi:hypothetical protein RO3G_15414 [Lichtheimia corymbifera JMRC:FSU:9682]|uniref:Uncharacterized protein n=1 Tax=Lichtheimia corymbifera JMRC:FSU:9682 TaxID=1263082 RepID=A0A068S810_9FUNG|nr:hypothetical protein RO3G_15414 [Lichtheimia corymbifera JMRC:FSU:9682]